MAGLVGEKSANASKTTPAKKRKANTAQQKNSIYHSHRTSEKFLQQPVDISQTTRRYFTTISHNQAKT